jgi:hypothetical protein
MAGISEAISKKDKNLDFGVIMSIKHFTDWKFKKVLKQIEIHREDLGITFKQLDYGSDLQIAKNLKVGDKVKLFIDSEYAAMWRRESEKNLQPNIHEEKLHELN